MQDEHADFPVVRYLLPEEKVVPFRWRPELEELLHWCAFSGHAAVRLVFGAFGTGKSRLALELSEEIAASGWHTLWLPLGPKDEVLDPIHQIGKPCLLVVDNAEIHADLAGTLSNLASKKDGPGLRILLLAHGAGEWVRRLLASMEEDARSHVSASMEAYLPISLGSAHALGKLQEIFDDAVSAFAHRMEVSAPRTALAISDNKPTIQLVHAAALLAVADHSAGKQPREQPLSELQVLDALLQYETRHWDRLAAGQNPNANADAARLSVVRACLHGTQNRIEWPNSYYPVAQAEDSSKVDYFGVSHSDQFAGQLVVAELVRLPELVGPLFTGLDDVRAHTALTLLGRAALRQESALTLTRAALAADFENLLEPALSVAVETNPAVASLVCEVFSEREVSHDSLTRVAAALPDSSAVVGAPAALVLQRLSEYPADETEHAATLISLSSRLDDIGQAEEAFATAAEAITIYRRLAEAQPDSFNLDLASALSAQSIRLTGLGRHEESLSREPGGHHLPAAVR